MYPINVSGGELFELIRPASLVLSALLSTWVLASALKRYSFLASLLWAIATFILPLITGPLYFAIILIQSHNNPGLGSRGRRWLISLAYGVVLLSSIGLYLWTEKRSADTFLARATQARVNNDHAGAIKEYRRALSVDNDAHIHKLLAIELSNVGMWREALTEFRLAERGGEPDDSLSFQIGVSLERLNLPAQAALEYRRFVASEMCTAKEPDVRCQSAEIRLGARKD